MFETLPATEQQEAKDYMQARIENLHRAADKDAPWFDFPGGGTLPKEKVSIDESLLVTPPAGMEYGQCGYGAIETTTGERRYSP